MATVFPSHPLQSIDMSHPVFHMVYEIKELPRRTAAARGRWWASASAAGWEWSTRKTA